MNAEEGENNINIDKIMISPWVSKVKVPVAGNAITITEIVGRTHTISLIENWPNL